MEASAVTDDLESNLRLFAMRRAAAASKEFSDLKSRVLVSVQSGPSRNCPMHGKNGSSRKDMARELRVSAARDAKEAREARERSIDQLSSRRGSSLEPIRSYNSMPRRMSASPANRVLRNGSFQDNMVPLKKDNFTPRVDFKNTLRQFNPKDDERSRGHNMRSRHDSEPMDYHDSNSYFTQQLTAHNPYASNPKRNFVIENNSGPASLPITINNSRPPPTKFKLDLSSMSNSRPQTPIKSPTGSRPQSPRRVEFAEGPEVFFSFNGHQLYQRSASTDLPIKAKPILRNTHSDAAERVTTSDSHHSLSLIEQYEQQQHQQSLPEPLSPLVIEHTNLESSANCNDLVNRRKISNDDSLVQIYVPETSGNESDDGTLSAGSQDESTVLNKKNEIKRTMSAEVTSGNNITRKVPPMLNEWNRSQSFPPPANSNTNNLFESDRLQKQNKDGKPNKSFKLSFLI